MALVDIHCPICGAVLKTVRTEMDSSQDCVCTFCKERIKFSYNHRLSEVMYRSAQGDEKKMVQ